MSNWNGDGPSSRENASEVQVLRGTVESLRQQLIQRDVADAVRLRAEADAKAPPPESLELTQSKAHFKTEFASHSEEYRAMAWFDHCPGASLPPPLAAGWPPGYDPVKFTRRKCGLNDEGTALLGDPGSTHEPEPRAASFMDAFRPDK
jgi:hypothetical protein